MVKISKLLSVRLMSHVLLGLIAVCAAGCIGHDPWANYNNVDPNGNIFLQGYGAQPPRYGHGGIDSPSTRRARDERNRQAAARAERERREARRRTEERRRERDESRRRVQYPDPLSDDRPDSVDIVEDPPETPSDPQPEPEVTIEPELEPEPEPDPEPPAPKPDPRNDTTAYGRMVPGKTGLVYSPYAPDAGYVDVRGIAPGTLVKCPYTKKLFRVP